MSVSVNVLLVAGGGGGGAGRAGGGGGGWVIDTTQSLSYGGDFSVSVGSGGLGSTDWTSSSGGSRGWNSAFNGLTAIGWGGGMNEGGGSSTSGGSWGGATAPGNTGGTATSGQGNAWGNGWDTTNYCAGGGGGAGSAGANGTSSTCGNWGSWYASSISGSSVNYGGGGGGGGNGGTPWTGTDGGGNGQVSAGTNGTNGTDGLGGGGGGGSWTVSRGNGWNGGKGIVIISYVTWTLSATWGTVTTSGGNTIHTFTSSWTFTVTSLPSRPYATIGEYFWASLRLAFNGSSLDSSWNWFDANPTNMAFWPWKSGSACAIFNGSNSKEYVPFNSTLNSSWAITVWWLFKFASITGTDYLFMRGNLTVDWGFVVQVTAWTGLEFFTHTAPADNYLNTGFIPNTDEWYFLAFRFVPGTMDVFVNGEKIATKSVGSSLRTSASYWWTIGDSLWGSWNPLDAEADSFFIEARWWSDQEIRRRNSDFRWLFATL